LVYNFAAGKDVRFRIEQAHQKQANGELIEFRHGPIKLRDIRLTVLW
jgi:hypothetical protein